MVVISHLDAAPGRSDVPARTGLGKAVSGMPLRPYPFELTLMAGQVSCRSTRVKLRLQ